MRANLTCSDHVEVPFYSSESFTDVCIHCASTSDLAPDHDVYPTCGQCLKDCPKILRRKRSQFQPQALKKESLDATFFKCLLPTFVCIQYVNADCGFLGNFSLIDLKKF